MELLGRVTQIDSIRARLTEDASVAAFVVGEPGVGTTAFAESVADQLAEHGFNVHRPVAMGMGAATPWSALAALLRGLDVPFDGPDLAVIQAATDALHAEAGRSMVLVDDVHRVDDASAALIFHAVSEGATGALLTAHSRRPLPQPLEELAKSVHANHLELRPLERSVAEQIVTEALGADPTESTAERLWRLAAGFPRLIHEVVAALQHSDALRVADGRADWWGELPQAARLDALVDRRLADLSVDEVAALELVALTEPIGVGIMDQLVSSDVLIALERQQVVQVGVGHESPGERGHDRRRLMSSNPPLIGAVMRQRLPALRRSAHYERVASAIDSRGARRPGDRVRTTVMRLEASGSGEPDTLTDASWRATLAYDNETGERLARVALERGGNARSAYALAFSLNMQNRFEESETLMGEWWQRSLDLGPKVARPMIYQRIFTLHRALGRLDQAERCLREALAVSDDLGWEQQIQGLQAYVLSLTDYVRGARVGRPLIEDESSDAMARVFALQAAGTELIARGRTDDAFAVIEPMVEVADALSHVFPRAAGFTSRLRGRAALSGGLHQVIIEATSRTLTSPTRTIDQQALGATRLIRGEALLIAGDPAQATEELARSLQHLELSDPAVMRPRLFALSATALAQLGRAAEAMQSLAQAQSFLRSQHANQQFRASLSAAQAWVASADGDSRAAIEHALRGATETPVPIERVLLVHTAHRLGAHYSETAQLIASTTHGMQSALALTIRDHSATFHTSDPAKRESVAASYQGMGCFLLAAEALIEAAEGYAARKNVDGERRCAAHASELLTNHCAGAHTPAVLRLRTPGLTARERAIAIEAARGLSNADIAEQLDRSVRTVEWHLQQIYTKFGVSSRQELAAILEVDD